jgi:hypothetical protein
VSSQRTPEDVAEIHRDMLVKDEQWRRGTETAESPPIPSQPTPEDVAEMQREMLVKDEQWREGTET